VKRYYFDLADFRARLSASVEESGVTPKRLSLIAGLNETAIRDLMERVDNPTILTVTKVAHALGVGPIWLMYGSLDL
jgi:hypothetical protein